MLNNIYLRKQYCEGLYDFIVQKNKHIFVNKNESQHYQYKYFGAFPKDDIHQVARLLNGRGIIKKITSKEEFLAEIQEEYSYNIQFYNDNYIPCDNNFYQYVKQFLYDNPIYHKDLMNKYFTLASNRLDHDLLDLVNDAPDKKTLVSLLNKAPLSEVKVSFTTPQQLEEILNDKGLTEKEIDDFFIGYYKARKNQIKDAEFAPVLRDYLLERFDRDQKKIEPYFEFFPFVKNYFYASDIDVFEDCAPSSVVTYFNVKKMVKAYSLDNWVANDYHSASEKFVDGFVKYFDSENGYGYVDTVDTPKGLYIIVITHESDSITKESFQKLFNEFFNYLYTEQKFVLSEDSIAKWISQHLLKNSLENMNTTVNSPIKKNKI